RMRRTPVEEGRGRVVSKTWTAGRPEVPRTHFPTVSAKEGGILATPLARLRQSNQHDHSAHFSRPPGDLARARELRHNTCRHPKTLPPWKLFSRKSPVQGRACRSSPRSGKDPRAGAFSSRVTARRRPAGPKRVVGPG